ncbi:guanine nucleotide-binding protein subunit alpha [Bonamia ostreae]|uniref:Guanine nucleotide-binding protein subunit alpha n=1 Tax=Bonamia ostreae TaxID=126728 RepID=A0ABV2APH7_9EUKA
MFDDYTGPEKDFKSATDFVKKKFIELNNAKGKEIYTHVTCATNNSNIKHVMAAVTDVFIKKKLAKGGLLY